MTYKAVGRSIINYAADICSQNLHDANYKKIKYTQNALTIATCSHERNVVLYGRPPPIHNSENDLSRKERSTLAQLKFGYCGLLGSYNSRIKKDATLNVWADWGMTPHNLKHLFVCPAHTTTITLSDIWSRLVDDILEFSYLEARDPD